jgi:cytidyltransferase-like protein
MVSGGFGDLQGRRLRFLEQAAKLGPVTVLLWSDELLQSQTGKRPEFPFAERLYVLNAVRYVQRVEPLSAPMDANLLTAVRQLRPRLWVDEENEANAAREAFCREHGLEYCALGDWRIAGFAPPAPMPSRPGKKKVVVTGCFDWFHSGHVRFFEEVSAYGDLYVIVGNDANIRLLKGQGHPLVGEQERRYCVASIRFVKEGLISSGEGWLDADQEIRQIKPDIYAVNEDGDKGGKRDYCAAMGMEYLVLKRVPAPGLRPRSSTELRGF